MKRNYTNEAIDVLNSDRFTIREILTQIFKDRPSAIVHASDKLRQNENTPTELERITLSFPPNLKIQAIKRYREITKVGLKEAKEAVENIWTKYNHGVSL